MLEPSLQYHSLKTVLEYMDANIRLQISLRMPSIRNVERVVPLKLNYLNLRDGETKVNDTSYKLWVVRHYPDGNTPRQVESENISGRRICDYDEFGFPIFCRNVLLPGDISFREEDWTEHRIENEVNERRNRDKLRIFGKALERCTELQSQGIAVEDYIKNLKPLPDDELNREENIVRRILKSYHKRLRFDIEDVKVELLPFDCRLNNTKPPFACYIQLTITNGESKQIQRFEYTKKLYEAVKHLNDVFFRSRTMPIRIERLDFFAFSDQICRLPMGVLFHVHKVHNFNGSVAHRNFPSLVENVDNLDCLWIHYWRQEMFESRAVRNAKRIVIVGGTPRFMQYIIQIFRKLSNLEMFFLPWQFLLYDDMLQRGENFLSEDYLQLIQGWLPDDRRIGASFWMGIGDEETAREILELVQTRTERTERIERCVTIRRDDSTKVEVFYEPFKRPRRKNYDITCKWIMKARIVQA